MKIDIFSVQHTVAQIVVEPDPREVLALKTDHQTSLLIPIAVVSSLVIVLAALLIYRRRHHR